MDGVKKCHGAFIEVYKRTAKNRTVLPSTENAFISVSDSSVTVFRQA